MLSFERCIHQKTFERNFLRGTTSEQQLHLGRTGAVETEEDALNQIASQQDGCGCQCVATGGLEEEEEEEPYLRVKCMFVRCPTYLHLYPCTLPTAPVSRSFGLRSSYEIDILDTDQRPRNKSLRLLNQFKLSM